MTSSTSGGDVAVPRMLPRGRFRGTALERFIMVHAPLNDQHWRAMLAEVLTEVTGDRWLAEQVGRW